MGDDDDNGGSRPDTSAATMQAFLNGGGTEDGVAEQIPPRNEQEAKEASENGGGVDGGGGLFINQGMFNMLYFIQIACMIPLLLQRICFSLLGSDLDVCRAHSFLLTLLCPFGSSQGGVV